MQLCLLERRALSGVDAGEVPPANVGAGVAGTDGEAGGRHLARAVGDLSVAAGVLSVTMSILTSDTLTRMPFFRNFWMETRPKYRKKM